MKRWIIKILFWASVAAVFFYFCSVSVVEFGGYKKTRIETRTSGDGLVLRMKPSDGTWMFFKNWELWIMRSRVENKKLFPFKTKEKGPSLYDTLTEKMRKRLGMSKNQASLRSNI